MPLSPILLFYRPYETDSFFRHDRYLKRILRPLYSRVTGRQAVAGFDVWFSNLVKGLRRVGCDVRKNDHDYARRHPDHPVGIVGYPSMLDGWDLPNPAILGPGMYDHPALRPDLMEDERFRLYIVVCDWMRRLFEPVYGACCVHWFAGIDTQQWPDTRSARKTLDVLVYDKIRWRREVVVREVLGPVFAVLRQWGLTFEVIRYQRHTHQTYRRLLRRARSMLFVCEHETQGLAYQEALASNVPVLAWDNGYWLDERRPQLDPEPIPATSVPYFSDECGLTFATAADFPHAFAELWENLPTYRPRAFVERELSLEASGRLYRRHYCSLAPS